MKALLTCIFSFIVLGVYAGGPSCTPDTSITTTGISPDTLPTLNEGQFYDVTATVVIPIDTIVNGTPADINFFQLNGTGGLPTWISVACEPPNCTFPGGSVNCVRVSGTPPCGSAGNYPLEFYITLSVTVITPFGPQVLMFDDTISGFFLEVLPMAAPANVNSNAGISNVTLSWDAVPGATGYQVKGGPVGNINAATLNLTNTSITVNNLAVACYEWYVRAKCDATTFGSWSVRDTFCTGVCVSPAPIAHNVFGATSQNVTLSWTQVSGAIGYQVQGGPGTSSTAVMLNVSGGASTSLTVNNLACGTYSWRVRAVCKLNPFIASPYTAFDIFATCPAGKTDMTGNEFLSSSVSMQMYPNPANEQVKLVLAGTDVDETLNVSIYDMSGKEVYTSTYSLNGTFDNITITTTDFAKGIYQVVATNGATSVNERLIIAR